MDIKVSSRISALFAVSGMLAILILALWIGALEARHIEFDPVNGHFQNFNAEFRLWHGQRPFVDFPVYLGLGPVILPLPIFALLGGSLAASNFAYNFVSVLFVGASFGILLRLLRVTPAVAWTIAAALTAVPWPMEHGNDSAIGIRSFLPFAAVLLLLGLDRWRKAGGRPLLLHLAAGAVAGLMPLWSNDYGCPTMLTFSFVFLIAFAEHWKCAVRNGTVFAASAVASAIGVLTVVTLGHPAAWFQFNFGSVLGDQFWFYNPVALGKVYALRDIPHGWQEVFLCLPAAVYSLLWLWRRHDARLASLALVSVAAAGGAFVSGLAGTFELRYFLPLWRVGIILVPGCAVFALAPVIGLAPRLSRRIGVLARSDALGHIVAVYMLATAALVFTFEARGVFWHLPTKADVFVPELGGSVLPSYLPAVDAGRKLKAVYDAEHLPPDRRLFSTYATATALIAGSRQDGPDYLIHALGDKARAQFVHSLDLGYQNVETIDPDLMVWGRWNIRESWPFYRKLFADWKPVGRTPWSLIWARRTVPLQPGPVEPCSVTGPGPGGFWTLTVGGAAPPVGWTAEVVAAVKTAFKPLPIPLIGGHRLLEVVEAYDGGDRDIDLSEGLSQIMAFVTDTWTLKLSDGFLELPLSVGPHRKPTLSMRAWPSGRASLSITGCTARLMYQDSLTTLDEVPNTGGRIAIAPVADAPQDAEPFLIMHDTDAMYLITIDPLSPAKVRVGDLVTYPDGRKGRVLMRDFREIVVSWPGGPALKAPVRFITVSHDGGQN
jgi:hypothetical protein